MAAVGKNLQPQKTPKKEQENRFSYQQQQLITDQWKLFEAFYVLCNNIYLFHF